MEPSKDRTPVLFFTGKGGVGKTSVACATGVSLVESGLKVLIVSTDPASNLDEVLSTGLNSDKPTPVAGVDGLSALNLDPDAVAHSYRENVIGPYRGVLPDAAIASMEEQLSGACTLEIAAFDQFARILAGQGESGGYDHVIFDTAPTGHTLRLLELPSAWTEFFAENTTGSSCLGPLTRLQAERERYSAALKVLRDRGSTTLYLVTSPEATAIAEAGRSSVELRELGVNNQHLIVNGVFKASSDDPLALALEARTDRALGSLPATLAGLPRTMVPLASVAPLGIAGLKTLAAIISGRHPSAQADGNAADTEDDSLVASDLTGLIDEIESSKRGVIMTMGKGGVGKTTLATTLALALADRGHQAHLTTTDPADHLAASLYDGGSETLMVSRIDPIVETENYSRHVLETVGMSLDDQGRALLEEDLRSPCTEEIAVFNAFARVVAEGEDGFVIIDTAPTGHTLLLLDAAEAYHREVLKKDSDSGEAIRKLLPRLRDPEFTRVMIVTLPESTPVSEAISLEADLARAGIGVYAWVINQSLTPHAITDPVLRSRRAAEASHIRNVASGRERVVLLPWADQQR